MPHFLYKNRKSFSVNFEEIANEQASEPPFWEIQRGEVVDILTTFFTSWQASWQSTGRSLGNLNLTSEDLSRLNYYEHEQKSTVLHLLAEILVAWEKDDNEAFSESVLKLARELRPYLNYFEPSDSAALVLTPSQTVILKNFTRSESASLKTTIESLQRLAWHKLEFGDKVLTVPDAESLLAGKLGLSHLAFLDFELEPDSRTDTPLHALLQPSAELEL
ncbi:hypothetical protein IKE71_01755 [Candidatus Saccharibacteria bacterium]|nr:hypothetical protein [Candidatus Saccharibacteria bacterium]